MSGGHLHQMISQPPRRELRALLANEVPLDDQSDQGPTPLMPGPSLLRRLRTLQGLQQIGILMLGSAALALAVGGSSSWVAERFRSAEDALFRGGEVQLASMTDGPCHTAKPGERCHSDVVWAMRNRDEHPEWYIGLSNCSDFHDYQTFMHSQVLNSGARRCPRPCASDERTPPKAAAAGGCKVEKEKKRKGDCRTAVPGDNCYAHMIYTQSEAAKYPSWYPGITEESPPAEVQYYLHTERVCPLPCTEKRLAREDNITGCHSAMPGDACFADVLLAKDEFIEKHPEWYKGLTKRSSNDKFQAFLHAQKHEGASAEKKACPVPCNRTAVDAIEEANTCKTANVGDPCYDSVLWGATVGVRTHPEWYGGLTAGSPFEDFQAHLHKDNHTKCHALPCPCQRPAKGDACYKTMLWVVSEGLEAHPDRFEGLTRHSSFEDVQGRLHELRTSACGRPCKTFDEDSRAPWRRRQDWL